MTLKSNNTAVAVAIQPVSGTFTAPTEPDDYLLCSQWRWNIAGVTVANDEYTGSPFKNAEDVVGKKVGATFNLKMRPPGGASPPSANAFLIGRILQAAKMTEVRNTSAIPAAAEAVAGSGQTTTNARLGASASSTADAYKGYPLILSDNGSTYGEKITAIRDYDASKNAALPETLGGAPAANYQIPKFIGYFRDISSADPILLSKSVWIDGQRYDLKDVRVTGLQIVVPTTTKDQAAYPELQVTIDCEIDDYAEEATPAVTPGGAVPFYKDGDGWLANTEVGLQTFTVDLGLQTENPPNPNKATGNDPAELVGGVAKVTMTRQMYRKTTLDSLALADAQAQHAFFAQWGSAAGNFIQILVPDGRFDFPNIDLGGNFVMESHGLMIDAFDRSVCIVFPY